MANMISNRKNNNNSVNAVVGATGASKIASGANNVNNNNNNHHSNNRNRHSNNNNKNNKTINSGNENDAPTIIADTATTFGGGGDAAATTATTATGATACAATMKDICNLLQPPNKILLQPGPPAYDHIIELMRGLDLQDDGIEMNRKIKVIEADFCNLVRDENILCESMEYINARALNDAETALKFALLFSSRSFDALAMNKTKVRSAMLKILETNFLNAETFRCEDRERLYNSITLLGEYYNRVRLADNSPITILGESLLELLLREVNGSNNSGNMPAVKMDSKLAKSIVSQVTLNGDLLRARHKQQTAKLLFHIRRIIIEQSALKPAIKALLLMTLDLFYSNFASLGDELEAMYTNYYLQDDDDDDYEENDDKHIEVIRGNHHLKQRQQQQKQSQQKSQSQQFQQQVPSLPIYPMATSQQTSPTSSSTSSSQEILRRQISLANYNHQKLFEQQLASYGNGGNNGKASLSPNSNINIEQIENVDVSADEIKPSTKKWSEQVCEEYNDLNMSSTGDGVGCIESDQLQERLNNSFNADMMARGESYDETTGGGGGRHGSRRSYQQKSYLSKSQHKQNYDNERNPDRDSVNDDDKNDETKPLPRWRTTRFNRDFNRSDVPGETARQHMQRRFSGSYDEDQQSVRSEGGSIRIYSVSDRLKHIHPERNERDYRNNQPNFANNNNNNNNGNHHHSSNWDRRSQHDDRSERSYASNYERGPNHRRGNRYQKTYDKPPRFQKNQMLQQQQQQQNKDNNTRIYSDTWQRTNNNIRSSREDINNYRSNGPESNSRESSRARTLPRPGKSNIDGNSGNIHTVSYRRSQSPNQHHHNHNPQHYHHQQQQYHNNRRGGNGGGGSGGPRGYNSRYSSQSSLNSDTSSHTIERRQHTRNFGRRSYNNQHGGGGSGAGGRHNNANFSGGTNGSDKQQHNTNWEDTTNSMPDPRIRTTNVDAVDDNDVSNWVDRKENSNDDELVRNARQTVNYMNYLSSKQ